MKKNYNGKARNTRNQKRRTWKKDENIEKVDKATNDPSWYSKYPQLVNDVGSLFFSNPLGSYIPRLDTIDNDHRVGINLNYVPGITALECIAVPGYSNSATSPVNAIARGIYSYIRHANSGRSNYDAPDLMMYLLAMDTCYSFWATCVRAYGIARMYNIRSRYLAVQYLKVMGFDAENILHNLAQFRALINNFAVKLSSYAVPASMDFFKRHTEMYTRVYSDEPSPKAQSYLFKLGKYYKFVNTTQDGGKLILTDFPNDAMTIDDVQAVFNDLFTPIVADEDMNIMSGDILKAYGEGAIYKLLFVTEDYVTPIVFDEVVLSQIENSMAVPELDVTSLGVTQDPLTSSIYFAPVCDFNSAKLNPKKLLNIHHDNPAPMDVMESTRLMFSIEIDANNTAHITNFGAELVLGYTVYVFDRSGVLDGRSIHTVIDVADNLMPSMGYELQTISNLCNFNFHPRVCVFADVIGTPGAKILLMDIFSLDNYTVLEDTTLASISNTAMLSLFDVGRIALTQ